MPLSKSLSIQDCLGQEHLHRRFMMTIVDFLLPTKYLYMNEIYHYECHAIHTLPSYSSCSKCMLDLCQINKMSLVHYLDEMPLPLKTWHKPSTCLRAKCWLQNRMIGSHSCVEAGMPMAFASILDSVTESNTLLMRWKLHEVVMPYPKEEMSNEDRSGRLMNWGEHVVCLISTFWMWMANKVSRMRNLRRRHRRWS